MSKITKPKSLTLISSGMFIIALSQILSHYIELPDFLQGLLMGIGIALLLLAVSLGKFKPAR
ncbi:hypothetical protein [Zunongwangia sp. H14]|uniref:hypothetical protein n=1 Tax=Zunongwangia sp. H14 TaxID=3240792 RepID=UPI003563EF7C